jgi:hypothetical protein
MAKPNYQYEKRAKDLAKKKKKEEKLQRKRERKAEGVEGAPAEGDPDAAPAPQASEA